MTSITALVLIVGSTVLVVAWLARHENFDLGPTPWDLADVARRQIPILAGQAAVAVTGVVLLLTLARGTEAGATPAFDAVIAMLLVAFLSFIGTAVQLTFVPPETGRDGPVLSRSMAMLSGNQHYRTLFLMWLALAPLVETYGLDRPAKLLAWLLGMAALAGWLIVASAIHRAGVLRWWEAFLMPTVGIALTIVFSLAIPGGTPTRFADIIPLTLAIFLLNALTMTFHSLAPVVFGNGKWERLRDLVCRNYMLADLQATVVILTLLWLSVS